MAREGATSPVIWRERRLEDSFPDSPKINMDIITTVLTQGYGYIALHPGVFGVLALTYVLVPSFVTQVFQKLEDAVNGIKGTIFGVKFDMSQVDWDDSLNHFLRDYVISLLGRANQIKADMSAGTLDVPGAEAQLESLTTEIVEYFKAKAPDAMQAFLEAKFGGDKVAAAEFVYRRIKGILFDVKNATDKKKE